MDITFALVLEEGVVERHLQELVEHHGKEAQLGLFRHGCSPPESW